MATRKNVRARRAAPKKEVARRAAPKKAAEKKSPAKKEPGFLTTLGSMAGTALGGALGGPAGGGIGGFLGGKLGHLIETVTGFGDYKVESNTILDGGMPVPEIVNSLEKGGVIVRHREFIGNIVSSTNFSVQSYLIQPGLADTFPWLSQMANSFEQYKLRGMLFEFVSTSSDALLSTATSTALGSVIMMTDYDVADPLPTSKRQMLNAEFSCSVKPSVNGIHPIECKKSVSAQDILYTRGAIAAPPGFDLRLYDFARFHIATEGMQAAGGTLGELWVTYEIELLKPQFAFFGLTDHFKLQTITNAAPLGVQLGNNITSGGTIGGAVTATTYSFPRQISSGKWMFTYTVLGSGVANAFVPGITLTNASYLALWANNGFQSINSPNPAVAANQSTVSICGTFTVTGEDAIMTFTGTGILPGATNNGDLWITRIADSIGA